MVNEEKISTYYSPWKYFIDKIEADDIVYSYGNSKGILAKGYKGDVGRTTELFEKLIDFIAMNSKDFVYFRKAGL